MGWKDIPSFPDYQVTDDGRVRSKGRIITLSDGRRKTIHAADLTPVRNDKGYMVVGLTDACGKRRTCRVHRLVATTFIHNESGKPFINHIDNDRANNMAVNLEWCTHAENLRHMARQGRGSDHMRGKRSPNAKLDDDTMVELLSEARRGDSYASISRKYGLSKSAVARAAKGETFSRLEARVAACGGR